MGTQWGKESIIGALWEFETNWFLFNIRLPYNYRMVLSVHWLCESSSSPQYFNPCPNQPGFLSSFMIICLLPASPRHQHSHSLSYLQGQFLTLESGVPAAYIMASLYQLHLHYNTTYTDICNPATIINHSFLDFPSPTPVLQTNEMFVSIINSYQFLRSTGKVSQFFNSKLL